MSTLTRLFIIGILTILEEVQSTCRNLVTCPCGETEKNVTICFENLHMVDDKCNKLLGCKTCHDDRFECLECAEGFEGADCAKIFNERDKNQNLNTSKSTSKLNLKEPILHVLKPSDYNETRNIHSQTETRSRRVTRQTSTTGRKSCPDPGFVKNGIRQNEDGTEETRVRSFQDGEILLFNCIGENFVLKGEPFIDCIEGTWSKPLPQCLNANVRKSCSDPGFIKNGVRQNEDGTEETRVRSFQDGETLLFTCIGKDFVMKGESFTDCVDGAWTNPIPQCLKANAVIVRTCPDPGFVKNGNRVNADGSDEAQERDFEDGESLLFSCNGEEYIFEGSAILDCKEGQWSHELPRCYSYEGDQCNDPGYISNGYRKNDDGSDSNFPKKFDSGESLSFVCLPEHTLRGSPFIICDHGEWSDATPTCIANNIPETGVCMDPGIVLHSSLITVTPKNTRRTTVSTIDIIEHPMGTKLTYTCQAGLVLLGSKTITCGSDRAWSADPPVCSEDCGISVVQAKETITDRLFYGTKAVQGEWPWVVAIAVRSRGALDIICGGALINSRTVLTAAHCIETNSLTLYFGKIHRWDIYDNASIVEIRQSREVIRHKEFSSVTYENDIALIKFAPRIRFTDYIRPICLPSKESMARHLTTQRDGVVTGWGVNERSLPSDELMKVHLPVLTNEECMESYRKQNFNIPLTENMFCTGFGQNQETTCNGDSGSPLVFRDIETGRYIVEGIVSFGVSGQCGRDGRYPAFTKVGRYASWIRRNERGSGGGRWSGE